MTAGRAIELADAMRDANPFDDRLKKEWLRQLDALLRAKIANRCQSQELGESGADLLWDEGLDDGAELLAPAPYDAIYPQWLCAQMDLALGETERYGLSYGVFTQTQQEFAAWARRSFMPWTGRIKT